MSIDECVCSEQTTTPPVRQRRPRSHERGQRRDRRRVLDVAVPARGQAEQLREPAHDVLLELGQRRAGPPEDADLVERRRQQLGEDRRLGARVREVGEEPRVLPVRRRRQDQPVHVLEQRRERLRLVRRRGRQPLAQPARLDLREHRVVADLLEVARRPLDRRLGVVAEAHLRTFATCGQVRVFRTCCFVSHARRA